MDAPKGLRVLRSDGVEDLYEDGLQDSDKRGHAGPIDSWHGCFVHDDGRLDVLRILKYETGQQQRYVACYSATGWGRVTFGREYRWNPPSQE